MLSADGAVGALAELAMIRRLVDGMIAKTAKRVADTNAHATHAERNAATFVARTLGVSAE